MEFREHAQNAAKTVCTMLDSALSDEQEKRITEIIEHAVIEAVREDGNRCAKAAMSCCSADRDLAHKVADEIRRTNTALIANLSSMR